MDLKSLSNSELSQKLHDLVLDERRITTEVLHHLREVERRMLYATLGYPSLISYCIEGLKYSESAAYRRVQSMRLLKELPEIEAKIQSGDLNLTTVSQTASYFKQVKKQKRTTPGLEEKRRVLKSVENLSRRETERVLAELDPEIKPEIFEKKRLTSTGDTHVSLVLDAEVVEALEEIQKLNGKRSSLQELIKVMAKNEIERLKKQKGISETHKPSQRHRATPPAVSVKVRPLRPHIPRQVKNQVWKRANMRCEYEHPETGKRCRSEFGLQIEHVQPVALGGANDFDNLSLLCPAHNRMKAVRSFGQHHMKRYLVSLRG